eukprot:8538980-Alexandrium_andersonii.AAC.1
MGWRSCDPRVAALAGTNVARAGRPSARPQYGPRHRAAESGKASTQKRAAIQGRAPNAARIGGVPPTV